MNGQVIVDKFNNFVDDEIDSTLVLQLANDAIHEIEMELQLYINEKVDSSNTTTIGQTYTTAEAMPSDFLTFAKPYIYVGTYKYYGVSLADKMLYKDTPYKFYYDPADGIHLCGIQTSVQTIHIPYIKSSTDITLSTSPSWPSQFHSLIPLWMAVYFYPIDGGEKDRSWAGEYSALLERAKQRMIDWDAKLKLAAIGGRTPTETGETNTGGIPIGLM